MDQRPGLRTALAEASPAPAARVAATALDVYAVQVRPTSPDGLVGHRVRRDVGLGCSRARSR